MVERPTSTNDSRRGIRAARYAGSWYPAEREGCLTLLDGASEPASATAPPSSRAPLRAVMPHAGLAWSGAVQGEVLRALAPVAGSIGAVVVLSPSHYHALAAGELIASPFTSLEVPGGALTGFPLHGLDRPESEAAVVTGVEHGIELLLPALSTLIGAQVPVASVVVGPLSSRAAAQHAAARLVRSLEPLERAAVSRRLLVIASSDFTHYGRRFRHEPWGPPDATAARRAARHDRGIAALWAAGDLDAYYEAISAGPTTICGRHPMAIVGEIVAESAALPVAWGTSFDPARPGQDFVNYVGLAPVVAESAGSGAAPARWFDGGGAEDDDE